MLLLFGAVGATGEFRHRTLAPAVLIAPDRLRLFVARTAAYALTGARRRVVMAIVAFAIGIPLLGGEAGPDLPAATTSKIAVGGLIVDRRSPARSASASARSCATRSSPSSGSSSGSTIVEPLIGLLGDDV